MDAHRLLDLATHWGWLAALVVLALCYRMVLRVFGAIVVPEDSLGVVNKKWALFGKNRALPVSAIIALNGEAGLQADTLAPGVHFGLWPWQFKVTLQKFITVDKSMIGVVEARDGKPLSGGRVLARTVECNAFQDARAFLKNGGERGPQISVIPPGTYRINPALFSVAPAPMLEIEDNMVGIVTTKDGQPLPTGDIAGKEVPWAQSLPGC
jgi:uncharacterized membrane protein YqiK